MENKILEILVDKTNLKWPAVFEHILIILHKVFEDFKTKDQKNAFSFEITKIGNRIRFFVVSPKKYTNFLKNQIYAHYSNVEIIDVWDYLSKVPDDKIKIWQVTLKEHFYFPIKTFTWSIFIYNFSYLKVLKIYFEYFSSKLFSSFRKNLEKK